MLGRAPCGPTDSALHPDRSPLTDWVEDVAPGELHDGVMHTAHLFQQRVGSVADLRQTR
ncbi:hypothetical protein AB0I49_00650 [Streptomyces sp. NPDC050617]|uniref:hypothetical protein n=1 Tax=Streptomyces sp. NPDC050617 TaxID=3154628 RepID=UPI0034465BEB